MTTDAGEVPSAMQMRAHAMMYLGPDMPRLVGTNTGRPYMPLYWALLADTPYESRRVRAGDLNVDRHYLGYSFRYETAEVVARFAEVARERNELGGVVLAMERADGSLWVYADVPFVRAAQVIDSDMELECGLYPDPKR